MINAKLTLLVCLLLSFNKFCFSKDLEIKELNIDESIVFETYDGPLEVSFKADIKYTLDPDPKSKMERITAMPFRGIYLRPYKDVFSVNETWFDKRVSDILEYCQNVESIDKLYEPKDKKDTGKAIACKAFIEDLTPIIDQDADENVLNDLKKKMKQAYIENALLYAYKYNKQRKAKNAPKFGTLTKVLQPLMSSFAYGNPYIAVAECYDSSEAIKKGKEIFRGFFLNKNLMMVLRRRMQFPFSENRLDWSMLNMDPETFSVYRGECMRTWMEHQQYLTSSKIEVAKKKDS